MLKKLPIKKEYLLIAGTLLLLLISYRLAFKNTIEAWQSHRQLQTQLDQSSDLNYQPGYLERKNNNLDQLIALYKADTTAFRSNIISTIAGIAERENVKLTDVPVQDVSFQTGQFIIEKLDFEGNYFSLLKLANDLQSTNGIGTIREETWRLKKSQSNPDIGGGLALDLYLEIIK